MCDEWSDPELIRFHAGEEAHKEWLDWSEPKPRKGVKLDLGPCVKAMRDKLPAELDHLQRRRQFLRLVAPLLALCGPAVAACPDQRHHGLRPPRRRRRQHPLPRPHRGLRRRRRRFPDERAGARHRRRQQMRPADHPRRQLAATARSACTRSAITRSGSARPTSPTPISRCSPAPMAAGPRPSRRTDDFAPALDAAMERKGIRLLHLQDRRRRDQQRDNNYETAGAREDVMEGERLLPASVRIDEEFSDRAATPNIVSRNITASFRSGSPRDSIRRRVCRRRWTNSCRPTAAFSSCAWTASLSAAADSSAHRPTPLI